MCEVSSEASITSTEKGTPKTTLKLSFRRPEICRFGEKSRASEV